MKNLSTYALRSISYFTLLVLGACTSASKIRQLTYPPDFRYYEQKEVYSTMWDFAKTISRLDQVLQSNEAEPAMFKQVTSHLEQLQRLATQLKSDPQASNHPMLSRNLPLLINDIEHAKNASQSSPRNYIPANRISASCRYCHIK